MRGEPHAGIVEHSRANAKLKEGLQKLGVHYGEIPRNTGTGHSCGHCSFGCAHGEKQDGTATFLADAVEAGAKIITGDRLPWGSYLHWDPATSAAVARNACIHFCCLDSTSLCLLSHTPLSCLLICTVHIWLT